MPWVHEMCLPEGDGIAVCRHPPVTIVIYNFEAPSVNDGLYGRITSAFVGGGSPLLLQGDQRVGDGLFCIDTLAK